MTVAGPIAVDPARQCAVAGGREIKLLPREMALLSYLLENQGIVLSRDRLLDAVWPGEYPVDRTVDDHIYRLRRKIEPALGFKIIHTLRGIGYVLRLPASPEVSLLRGLDGDPAREAYLSLVRGCIVRGAGRQLLALVHDPPPGTGPGPDEILLTAWLTGDLEAVIDAARGGSAKARVLAAMTARDLFGVRAATPELERALDGDAFSADGRIVLATWLAGDGDPVRAGEQLEAAREEIEAAGAWVLWPSLLRARATLKAASGDDDGAARLAGEGLDQAQEGGLVREAAWLSFLLTRVAGSPGYSKGLDLLHENRLGTDYLIMLRLLAAAGRPWREMFSAAAREFGLSRLAREFRRLFSSP